MPRTTISRNSAPSNDQGRQQHHHMPHRNQTQIISQLRTSPTLNRMWTGVKGTKPEMPSV